MPFGVNRFCSNAGAVTKGSKSPAWDTEANLCGRPDEPALGSPQTKYAPPGVVVGGFGRSPKLPLGGGET
jgi:hypothetical protein